MTGARPLFFLDYIGAERLDPAVFKQLISGFTKACKEGGCALIGGETAQLPELYQSGEYDLAGCIVGVVDRERDIGWQPDCPVGRADRLAVERIAHQWVHSRPEGFIG